MRKKYYLPYENLYSPEMVAIKKKKRNENLAKLTKNT